MSISTGRRKRRRERRERERLEFRSQSQHHEGDGRRHADTYKPSYSPPSAGRGADTYRPSDNSAPYEQLRFRPDEGPRNLAKEFQDFGNPVVSSRRSPLKSQGHTFQDLSEHDEPMDDSNIDQPAQHPNYYHHYNPNEPVRYPDYYRPPIENLNEKNIIDYNHRSTRSRGPEVYHVKVEEELRREEEKGRIGDLNAFDDASSHVQLDRGNLQDTNKSSASDRADDGETMDAGVNDGHDKKGGRAHKKLLWQGPRLDKRERKAAKREKQIHQVMAHGLSSTAATELFKVCYDRRSAARSLQWSINDDRNTTRTHLLHSPLVVSAISWLVMQPTTELYALMRVRLMIPRRWPGCINPVVSSATLNLSSTTPIHGPRSILRKRSNESTNGRVKGAHPTPQIGHT